MFKDKFQSHYSAKTPSRTTPKRRTVILVLAACALAIIIMSAILSRRPGGSALLGVTPPDLSGLWGGLKRPADPSNPLRGAKLYVNPASNAAVQAETWRTSQPDKAAQMDRLATQPTARWLTNRENLGPVTTFVRAAAEKNEIPVVVLYYITNRDCGLYSSGGAASPQDYRQMVDALAGIIGQTRTIIILEPDALAQMGTTEGGRSCVADAERQSRFELLRYAVSTLKALPATHVYIDAGNSSWTESHDRMAGYLKESGVTAADGFSLNVSNFVDLPATIAYGSILSNDLKGKHFVADTSRNGLGAYSNPYYPSQGWCNPPGRALGHYPTTDTGIPLVDAFLYIKYPGESDGTDPDPRKCFGGPKAGAWWPEYALGLIERWPAELQPPR